MTYNNTPGENDRQYTYRVRAYNATEDSDFSNPDSAKVLPRADAPLLARSDVVYKKNASYVSMGWLDNGTNADGYRIEKSIDSGPFEFVTNVSADTFFYSGLLPNNGSSVKYRVTAFNQRGLSPIWVSTGAHARIERDVAYPVPSGLRASRVEGTKYFEVEFESAPDVPSHDLEFSPDNGQTWFGGNAGFSSGQQERVSAGGSYKFCVFGYGIDGLSPYSATVSVSIPLDPPSLSIASTGSDRVTLAWQDSSDFANGYQIQMSVGNDGPWREVATSYGTATVSGTPRSRIMLGLSDQSDYRFRIRALDWSNPNPKNTQSDWSQPINVTTLPATPLAPTSLKAAATYGRRIDLNWTDKSDNEDNFELQYATNSSYTNATTLTLPFDTRDHTISGVVPNTTYYIRVRAINNGAAPSLWTSKTISTNNLNSPPVILGPGAVSTAEGSPALASGTYFDPDPNDIVTLSGGSPGTLSGGGSNNGFWDWQMPTTDDEVNNGIAVSVTATDGYGGTDSTSFIVNVSNVSPNIVDAQVTTPVKDGDDTAIIPAGGTFTAEVDFLDPGADSWIADIDWGDETPDTETGVGKSFNLSHVYAEAGEYTVNVTVEDDDGGSDSTTLHVVVVDIQLGLDTNRDGSITSEDDGEATLVDDWDVDGDGIPDYVDGYDLDPSITTDGVSTGLKFTPLKIDLDGITSSNAKLRFNYLASEPIEVTASLDQPYVLPTGKLRIWKKDGDQQRVISLDPGSSDFVKSDEYSLSQLGIAPGQSGTLYVEAVAQSTAVGDISIQVDVDPTGSAGYLISDTVSITAARAEIMARNYGETAFHFADRLMRSNLGEDPVSNYGYTPSSYRTYKIRVHDPRTTGLSEFIIDDQSISMVRVTGTDYYETEEFIAVGAGESINWSVPYQHIYLSGDTGQMRYNPFWPFSSGPEVIDPGEHRTRLAKEIEDAVAEMETEGWTGAPNDTGAFGREVHRRVSERLIVDPNWKADIYVGPDGTILSIGGPPAGQIPADTIQIDLVRVKQGQTIVPNDLWDHTKLDDLVEIKTSIQGKIRADQKQALKGLMNGGDIVVTNGTARRWAPTRGWHSNPKFANAIKLLGLISAVSAAWSVINIDRYDDEFDAVVAEAKFISERAYTPQQGGEEAKRLDVIELNGIVTDYLRHFVPSDTVIDLYQLGSFYYVLDMDFSE